MFIEPDTLDPVKAILQAHLPAAARVWAFGPRVHGRNLKPFSDLDLAVAKRHGETFAMSELAALADAFENSDLPWKVDVVDLYGVSPEFRALIEAEREETRAEACSG